MRMSQDSLVGGGTMNIPGYNPSPMNSLLLDGPIPPPSAAMNFSNGGASKLRSSLIPNPLENPSEKMMKPMKNPEYSMFAEEVVTTQSVKPEQVSTVMKQRDKTSMNIENASMGISNVNNKSKESQGKKHKSKKLSFQLPEETKAVLESETHHMEIMKPPNSDFLDFLPVTTEDTDYKFKDGGSKPEVPAPKKQAMSLDSKILGRELITDSLINSLMESRPREKDNPLATAADLSLSSILNFNFNAKPTGMSDIKDSIVPAPAPGPVKSQFPPQIQDINPNDVETLRLYHLLLVQDLGDQISADARMERLKKLVSHQRQIEDLLLSVKTALEAEKSGKN
eukprot:TRINITY_DN16552_c0_g1_i1.p1 TRINITY_DN16552_c0_g1~~TRINITY_DN16552_c0_g1_i1.p1  ORF type:complete len:339 (+),score=59.52 TRINITY_DN16552_c0_g1_i1:149-1165(+)